MSRGGSVDWVGDVLTGIGNGRNNLWWYVSDNRRQRSDDISHPRITALFLMI